MLSCYSRTSDAKESRLRSPPDMPRTRGGLPMVVLAHFVRPSCTRCTQLTIRYKDGWSEDEWQHARVTQFGYSPWIVENTGEQLLKAYHSRMPNKTNGFSRRSGVIWTTDK